MKQRILGCIPGWTTIVLIVLLGLLLFPIVWAVFNSFKNNLEIYGNSMLWPTVFRWENYRTAWVEGHFGQYFTNSWLLAAAVALLKVTLAAPAGFAFAQTRLVRHPAIFATFLLGMTIPLESIVVTLFYTIKSYGLINSIWGVALPLVSIGLPFSIFLMRSFFLDVPTALKEAARIDGAGTARIFASIMLPLVKPGLLVVAVLSFLEGWNEFMLSILVLIGEKSKTIPLGIVKFHGDAFHDPRYGPVFASVVISFVPTMLVYVLLQRSFIQGITLGAVK